jgi:hypothetical protein
MNSQWKTAQEWGNLIRNSEETMRRAIHNLPPSEIMYNAMFIHNVVPSGIDDDIATLLVQLRYSSAECNYCRKKGTMKFKRCEKCFLVFYCSNDCQKKDTFKHQEYCCNEKYDYLPEKDIYKIVFINKN